MIRRTVKTLAEACFFALLWLILVGNVKTQESLVGAFSVAGAALFVRFARRAQRRHFRYTMRDLLQLRRVPWNVLTDTLRVSGVFFRDIFTGEPARSSYVVLPFALSRRDAGLDGREVLAVAYATVSPNSIVLGVRQEDRQILVHLLEQAPPSSTMTALGIGPQGGA